MSDKDPQWPANTAVSYPGSDAFTNSTERWSLYAAPTFSSAVKPSSEHDVAEIVSHWGAFLRAELTSLLQVKLARASSIPFLATGGRHGYGTTLGRLDNGLAIDLSGLNTISIDAASETVTIGPGVTIGSLMGPVLEAGFEIRMAKRALFTRQVC